MAAKWITIRLPQDERSQIDRISEETGIAASKIVRLCIRRALSDVEELIKRYAFTPEAIEDLIVPPPKH